jgi:hypothetical protein
MKKDYIKTKWVDSSTPVNAANLNKIENGLADLFSLGLSASEVIGGDGVDVSVTSAGELKIAVTRDVLRSNSFLGIELVTELPEETEKGIMYFIQDPDTKKLSRIYINGAYIYGEQ